MLVKIWILLTVLLLNHHQDYENLNRNLFLTVTQAPHFHDQRIVGTVNSE